MAWRKNDDDDLAKALGLTGGRKPKDWKVVHPSGASLEAPDTDDKAADNIEAMTENRADALEEAADNTSGAAEDALEDRADNVRDMGEEKAEEADDNDDARVENQVSNAL